MRPLTQESDQNIERDRYEARAARLLSDHNPTPSTSGASSIPLPIRAPYTHYERVLKSLVRPGMRVLELGAGTGLHSEVLCESGVETLCCDISPSALQVLDANLRSKGYEVQTVVSAMQATPFADGSFDLIASAGSLSYADPAELDREVIRLLRPGGSFVCVDSLNHNPIYRFNRWLHWRVRGDRTRSTLERMPTIARMKRLGAQFESWNLRGFGAHSWICQPLARVVGARAAATLSDALDRSPGSSRMAFKFVFVATSPRPTLTCAMDAATRK